MCRFLKKQPLLLPLPGPMHYFEPPPTFQHCTVHLSSELLARVWTASFFFILCCPPCSHLLTRLLAPIFSPAPTPFYSRFLIHLYCFVFVHKTVYVPSSSSLRRLTFLEKRKNYSLLLANWVVPSYLLKRLHVKSWNGNSPLCSHPAICPLNIPSTSSLWQFLLSPCSIFPPAWT